MRGRGSFEAAPRQQRDGSLLGDRNGNARQAALTIVHYALMVVQRVVIEPIARDRLIVTVEPAQAGFTLESHRRHEISCWVGSAGRELIVLDSLTRRAERLGGDRRPAPDRR